MIYVKIYNKQNEIKQAANFDNIEEANEWVADQEAKTTSWRHKDIWTQEQNYKGEEYTDQRIVQDEFGLEFTEYFYPQNYTVEVVDSEDNIELKNNEIRTKRQQEYPAFNEIIEAVIDYMQYSDTTKLDEIKAKRDLVKQNNPWRE